MMANQESRTNDTTGHGEIQTRGGSISSCEISKPAFPVNLAAVLPCYRESEEELRVSIGNYWWRHSHEFTPFWHRNVLVPSYQEASSDEPDEFRTKLLDLVQGMCLFIVVDGSCDITKESSTLQAVRRILNIAEPIAEWSTLSRMNFRFKEIDDAFDSPCKVIVIVKTIPNLQGKRYSQSLCCRLLMRMKEEYPDTMKLEYLLLCDADTGFRPRDVYKSIEWLEEPNHKQTGLLQVNRRLLNHSFTNIATTLQYVEYNLITMRRKTQCGLGFLAEIDGSFIMMRYDTMVDIIDDFSTLLPLDESSICKYNASNLGEDTLMARLVNYMEWKVEQITDSDINHYLNGVTTFHDLFGQRRRWYNNRLSHMISDMLPSPEHGDDSDIRNFTYRPLPRIGLYLLWQLIGGSISFLLFIEPAMYIYLWSITAQLVFPSLPPIVCFSFFVFLMIFHSAFSFKQNPRNRRIWINILCFLCFLFTFTSWICGFIGILYRFDYIENQQLSWIGIETENMDQYADGFLIYLGIAVIPNLIQFLCYFALFNYHQGHLILSSYLLIQIFGGLAIYGFAINIWVVANYFDTKWGTRESNTENKTGRATADIESVKVEDGKLDVNAEIERYFPDLAHSKRPSLLGISICCSRLFQFMMPLLQFVLSGVMGYGLLNLVIHRVFTITIFVPSIIQTVIFILMQISAKYQEWRNE